MLQQSKSSFQPKDSFRNNKAQSNPHCVGEVSPKIVLAAGGLALRSLFASISSTSTNSNGVTNIACNYITSLFSWRPSTDKRPKEAEVFNRRSVLIDSSVGSRLGLLLVGNRINGMTYVVLARHANVNWTIYNLYAVTYGYLYRSQNGFDF